MSISIRTLNIAPDKFKKGPANQADITFKGLVSSNSENPVTITLSLGTNSQVFLVNSEDERVKEISWSESLSLQTMLHTRKIEILVAKSPARLTPEDLTLTATTKTGKQSDCSTAIYYE